MTDQNIDDSNGPEALALAKKNRERAKAVVDEQLGVAVALLSGSIRQGVDIAPVLTQISDAGAIMLLEKLTDADLENEEKQLVLAILEERRDEARQAVEKQLNLAVKLITSLIKQNVDVDAVLGVVKGVITPDIKKQLLETNLPQPARDKVKAMAG